MVISTGDSYCFLVWFFFLEIPTFPFLLFYLVTQISLQSLFLPNEHLSPAYFPQIYLVPYFSRRQMILISTPIMQIHLLVYIHWKICTVNTHSFFQMLNKVMKWEITSFSTSQDIHEAPPNPLTLSVICHLVFQNWSCQVLEESKSESTPTASRDSDTKGCKKTGFETRSRESEANTVRFTKKA